MNHRKKIKELLAGLKSRPCEDCGIQYPWYVMQFDHVRGKKEFMLGKVVNFMVSMERVLAEVAKCDVVCSNCHHARTYLRRTGVL